MRRQVHWLALGVVVAASACASGRESQPANPPLEIAKACADWRWIGIRSRSAASCPAVDGWSVRPLFAPQAASKEEPYAQRQQRAEKPGPAQLSVSAAREELQRFCVYETADGRGGGHRRFPPAVSADLVRFDQDCAALAIAADPPLPAAVWRPASAAFLAQAGKPATPLEIKNQLGVRLAFLDTQPTGVGVPRAPGYSQHGYTLAHIARHLICSPETSEHCAAQITTRLALPLTSFDAGDRSRTGVDRAHGGHVGMQSDLAAAISGEVDDWLVNRRRADAPQHLVLNLSLGWDPRLFGGLDEAQIAELRAGTQAVYRALQYAASLDVLVLGAAGNQKACPGEPTDGPLLPGGWERAGPRERSCGGGAQAPLVYAVGGLQSDGSPLWNARPGGMPRRGAYAEHAIVPTFDPERPTAMYTGSSVATAVASSIAAIVWDTVPNLDARGVMALLDADASGDVLARNADFWFAPSGAFAAAPPRVHRLSLCAALAEACGRPGAQCPLGSRHCAPWDPAPLTLAGLPSDHVVGGTCQPWLYPQPEDPPCPNCIKEPPH